MKTRAIAALAAAQLAFVPISNAQEPAENKSNVFWDQFVVPIHERHLEGIGLVLWGMDDLVGQPKATSATEPPGLFFRPVLRTLDGKRRPGVGVLRIQDGLDVTVAEPQAATYQWISDASLGDYWNLDAAAILDVYLPSDWRFSGTDRAEAGLHFRAGVSWERNTLQENETDRRELFLGASFQPFYGEFFGRGQITDTQVGFLYQEDAITDASAWTLSLNIQPTTPFRKGGKFVLGQKMTFREFLNGYVDHTQDRKAVGQTNLEPKSDQEQLGDVFFIRPNISFDALLDDFSQDGNVDFADYCVTFGGRLGFSMFNQHLTASYKLAGVSPVDNFGDTHVFHEARLEYQPFRDWSLRFTAAYQYGERAPDFKEEDRIVLSAGLRF